MSDFNSEMKQLRRAVLVEPFPYWLGAVLLAVLNIAYFTFFGSPWGVTSAFAHWGAWVLQKFGARPETWHYYANSASNLKGLNAGFLRDSITVVNLGIIVGALLAVLLASQFKFKKIKSYRQVVGAVVGGLLMGYGARIAFGCNIGAFFSGIPSFSLHGWVFAIFIFVGAAIGSKILVRYLM